MCDNSLDPQPQTGGFTRREFAVIGATAALTGCAGHGAGAPGRDLAERMVTIPTGDGVADAFYVHPAAGTHPAVICWPDIAGLRDAFKTMARRLAGEGYAVLVVNPYYRNAPAPVLQTFAEWRTPDGQARLKPMIAAITPQGTAADAAAFVRFLDGDDAVDKRRGIGTHGYCMGGPFTVLTAAAAPERVRAAASFHGARLVTDAPDSPHRLLARTKASYLFAISQDDDAKAPGDKDALRDAAAAAGRSAEVEVYPANHGWCVLDSPVYDKEQAERAWARMLALFAKL